MKGLIALLATIISMPVLAEMITDETSPCYKACLKKRIKCRTHCREKISKKKHKQKFYQCLDGCDTPFNEQCATKCPNINYVR